MIFLVLTPIIVALVVLLLVVYLVDINYFIRVGVVFLYGWFVRRPLKFTDESNIYGRVLPFDVDIQLTHMNNARVLREYDFGRMDFFARCGLMKNLLRDAFSSMKPQPVFAVASTIRYRRPLHLLMKYKIVTKVVHWEDKILYHEQKMVTLNDNITRNIGYCKVIFPFSIDEFVKKVHPEVEKPKLPKDLEIWIKFNEANSFKSRPKKPKESDGESHEEEYDELVNSSESS